MNGLDVGGPNGEAGSRQTRGATGPALLLIAVAILGWRAVTRPDVRVDRPAVPIASLRVDVNRASAAELALLPEIGPSMAETIIADRTARGGFASVEDLGRVRGIGPATIAALKPHATAGGTSVSAGEARRDGGR